LPGSRSIVPKPHAVVGGPEIRSAPIIIRPHHPLPLPRLERQRMEEATWPAVTAPCSALVRWHVRTYSATSRSPSKTAPAS
jgi:hypothetical protein